VTPRLSEFIALANQQLLSSSVQQDTEPFGRNLLLVRQRVRGPR
jgi:hypothetical protein